MKTRPLGILVLTLLLLILSVSGVFADGYKIKVGLYLNQWSASVYANGGLSIVEGDTGRSIKTVNGTTTVQLSGNCIYAGGIPVNSSSVILKPVNSGACVMVGGKNYRGSIIAMKNSLGRLHIINFVDIEDYVAGVVGGEVPSSWNVEALKAQAVAARSYVLYKVANSANSEYDVLPTTSDQVYVGASREDYVIRNALKQTKYQVLARNGNIIKTYYHSTCGGHTTDSNLVFSSDGNDIRGVQDPFCASSPHGTWSRGYSAYSIARVLSGNGISIGTIYSMTPVGRDGSGRVTHLSIQHSGGSYVIKGTDFRRMMGYQEIKSTKFDVRVTKYRTCSAQELAAAQPDEMTMTTGAKILAIGNMASSFYMSSPSLLDDLELLAVETKTLRTIPETFSFYGRGWGHGVGMCQWGAERMAESGYSYYQILMYYYPDTELCTIQEPSAPQIDIAKKNKDTKPERDPFQKPSRGYSER